MASSLRVVADEISGLLTYLAEAELALSITAISRTTQRVSWQRRPDAGPLALNKRGNTVGVYRQWVHDNDYSAMLFDGSLLQISYTFDNHGVSGHRLLYMPCPWEVELDLWDQIPVLDVIDDYAAGSSEHFRLRTPIRFDYDPSSAKEGHPAAHLTINSADCRIASAAAIRLGEFVDIVFRNFYPDIWKLHPFLDGMDKGLASSRTITASEMKRAHISWVTDAQVLDLKRSSGTLRP